MIQKYRVREKILVWFLPAALFVSLNTCGIQSAYAASAGHHAVADAETGCHSAQNGADDCSHGCNKGGTFCCHDLISDGPGVFQKKPDGALWGPPVFGIPVRPAADFLSGGPDGSRFFTRPSRALSVSFFILSFPAHAPPF